VQRFRGGLVFKAHRLCVSLNSRLESDKKKSSDLYARVLQADIHGGQGLREGDGGLDMMGGV